MKRNPGSVFFRNGVRWAAGCLLANAITLCAQNAPYVTTSGPPPGGTNVFVQASGGFGGGGVAISINGSDIGTILLKACDLNQDGKVTLAELQTVADDYFKAWDTNSVGSLSSGELSAGFQALFPAPPPGGAQAVAVVNGVAVQVPPEDMPTPDKQLAKHIMAQADANQDGQLSLQELNDWLGNNFSQWDTSGDGALDASELGAAFGQLARPD
jgi:Ca2+-binding EF-hand superfamily protein